MEIPTNISGLWTCEVLRCMVFVIGRSVCLSMFVHHNGILCKKGWTDRDVVWNGDSWSEKKL